MKRSHDGRLVGVAKVDHISLCSNYLFKHVLAFRSTGTKMRVLSLWRMLNVVRDLSTQPVCFAACIWLAPISLQH